MLWACEDDAGGCDDEAGACEDEGSGACACGWLGAGACEDEAGGACEDAGACEDEAGGLLLALWLLLAGRVDVLLLTAARLVLVLLETTTLALLLSVLLLAMDAALLSGPAACGTVQATSRQMAAKQAVRAHSMVFCRVIV